MDEVKLFDYDNFFDNLCMEKRSDALMAMVAAMSYCRNAQQYDAELTELGIIGMDYLLHDFAEMLTAVPEKTEFPMTVAGLETLLRMYAAEIMLHHNEPSLIGLGACCSADALMDGLLDGGWFE